MAKDISMAKELRLKRYFSKIGTIFSLENEGGEKNIEVNKFLESLGLLNRSSQTLASYGYDLLHFYTWIFSTEIEFKNITKYDLYRYIAYQKESEAAPRSINRRLSTCLQFYKFCFDKEMPGGMHVLRQMGYYKGRSIPPIMGLLPQRRVEKALRVKTQDPLIDPLKVEEVKIFFSSLKKYRDIAIVYLMLYCGLRSIEIINLKTSDISYRYESLLVRGKGQKQRKVVLPKIAYEALQKYENFERPKFSVTDHVFTVLKGKKRGSSMTRAGLRRLFRYRREKTKVHRANPHRFRHTFATNMARSGMSMPALKELLGHDDLNQVATYIRLSLVDLREEFEKAMEKIEKQYGQA